MGTSFTKINFLDFYRNYAPRVNTWKYRRHAMLNPASAVEDQSWLKGNSRVHQKSETHILFTTSKPMTIQKETYFSVYNQAKMQYVDPLNIWGVEGHWFLFLPLSAWREICWGKTFSWWGRAVNQSHSWNIYCGLFCGNVNIQSEGGEEARR